MAASQYYEQVQEAYLAYYGRPADPAGLAYWAAQLNAANGNMSAIINAFGNSAESTALYGGSSVAAQVNAIYETLFGRQADVAGLNYYVNGINNGTFTLASVALNIYNGAQGSDATELAAKLAYADAFTDAVGQSTAAQVGYVGTVAANTARAAVAGVVDTNSEASAIASLPATLANIDIGPAVYLTAGADNITGSNIVGSLTPYAVDGVGPTLNYNDVITGTNGSTNNTLTLNDDYAEGNDVIPLGAKISNIQNIVLQTQGNAGTDYDDDTGTAFNTSGIAGVLNVTVTSAGSGVDFVQAAGTTAVNVTHQSSAGEVVVFGGSSVDVTSNGSDGVQIGSVSVANVDPTGAVTVTETGIGADVSVFGGTTVNVNDSGPYGNIVVGAPVVLTSSPEPTGAVTVNSTGISTSVEVFGGTDVTVNTVGSGLGSSADVTIGAIGPNEQVYAPTGNVTVSVNEATAYQYDTATGITTSYESDVSILGGANVSVTTNAGNVTIGGDDLNGSSEVAIAGQNPTGTVSVTDTSDYGVVTVYGGTDVTVNSVGAHGNEGAAVVIGAFADNGQVFAPTGNVVVNVNQATAYEAENLSSFESDVSILGGANVTVTTNAGDVTIGDNAPNATDTGALAGQNPTGVVKVTDTSDLGNVVVYGGTNVTVNAAGGYVQVGSYDYNEGDPYVTAPTGTVTVTDTGPVTDSYSGGVNIIGGTDVSVTTNVGSVKVGTYSGIAGSEPTGTVDVTDTSAGRVVVDGGTDVTVSSAGGSVQIGTGTISTNPTGNVSVTESAIETGGWGEYKHRSNVNVAGGVNVTVNTTGGDVRVGTTATAVTGAVSINDTFVGSNADSFHVEGGTTVSITTTATSGDITVGAVNPADILNTDGTGLANAADFASGNVTIVDESVAGTSAAGSSNVYGTGNVTVNTDGAQSVSITGGSSVSVTDVETTAATGGANIGQAIGTSTLATVSLDGVSGDANITSDALSSLTVTDSARGSATDVTVTETPTHALSLTLGNDAWGTSITDETATSITITTTGTAASDFVLNAADATSLTFDNDAAVSLNGGESSISAVTTIVATGSGALSLGNLSDDSSLTSINASASSGAVSVTLDPNTTSFLGGSGNDTVTLDDAPTGTESIIGGSGNNTLVVNYEGEGSLANIAGFQTLEVGRDGSGTFDVAGFTSLVVGHGSGDVTFADVVAGTGLDITGSHFGTVSYVEGEGTFSATTALSLTLGTDDSSTTWSAPVRATVVASGLDNIDIDSEGFAAAGTNQLTIGDSAAQTITITGDRSVSVTLDDNSGSNTQTSTVGGSEVTTINASGSTGAVNLTGVALAASGATIIGGAGVLTAHGVEVPASLDVAQVDTVTIARGLYLNSVSITIDGQTFTEATTLNESAETIAADLVGQIGTMDGVTAALGAAHNGSYTITLTADTAGIGFTSSVSSTYPLNVGIGEAPTTANGDAAAQLGSQAVDSITTGSGGGVITIGQGGSWVEGSYTGGPYGNGIYGVGSETVNLSASTNVVDTIVVNDGAVSTFNGTAGGITGFQITANASTSDELTFGEQKTVLANVAAATHVSSLGDFNAAVAVLDPTGTLKTVLANLDYTVSNGVITFSGTGGHLLSDFTVTQLISAAEIIVNSGESQVATFSAGGNTYVVTDDAGATLATGGGGNLDSITELIGVTGVQGFGSTAAANTIVATDVTNQIANSSDSGTVSGAAVYDETGFSHAALVSDAGQTAGTTSTAFNNLAASAQLDISATGDLGQVTTTQLGASGSNSLTLSFMGNEGGTTLDTLTVTGDNALVIHANAVGEGQSFGSLGQFQQIIGTLVDATNTVTNITVDGTTNIAIGGISDTALTTFDASSLTGGLYLSANQNGLTIKGALGGDIISANGTGDTITVGDATHSISSDVYVSATGNGDTITLTHEWSSGTSGVLATGNGNVISVDAGTNYIGGSAVDETLASSLGNGDTINLASGGNDTLWVGSNSTVNIGSATTGLYGSANVIVTGDVTGTGSSGQYALTVINLNGANLPDSNGTLDITFNNVSATTGHTLLNETFAGGWAAGSQVNVASATSLANALDIAATQAAVLDSQHGAANTSVVNGVLVQNAGTGLVDYFQYGGNTYVVEAINSSNAAAAHTGLGAGDVVVELTGQVNIGTIGSFSGHQLQLTVGHPA
jgi:hypothetical protein